MDAKMVGLIIAVMEGALVTAITSDKAGLAVGPADQGDSAGTTREVAEEYSPDNLAAEDLAAIIRRL